VSREGSNNTCRSSPITAQRNHAGYIGRPSPRMRTRRVQQPAPSTVYHTACYATVCLSTLLSCRPNPPPPLCHQPGDTTQNRRSRPGWRGTLGVYAFPSSRVLGWVRAYGKHREAREGQPASGCAARIIEADRSGRLLSAMNMAPLSAEAGGCLLSGESLGIQAGVFKPCECCGASLTDVVNGA
jgi:hypothetical protein